MKRSTRKIVLGGLFIALGLLLPFLTGQIPNFGSMLLPMHIPVLLSGFIAGAPVGLVVGVITPLLRSVLLGTPPLFPIAFVMAFELAAYGLLAGLFYRMLPRNTKGIYTALIAAMIGGRLVWGLVSAFVIGAGGTGFTWQAFAAGAFVNAIPGIILQLVIVPMIVIVLAKARLIESR